MKLNFEIKTGLFIVLFVIIIQLVSFIFLPRDYNNIDHNLRLQPPGAAHFFGTDNFGRDIFSRAMAGGKNSLVMAVCVVFSAAVFGCFLGLLSGYLGGIFEIIIMRIIDILNSFPGLILALFIIALFDNSQYSVFLALLILFIPSFTRVMRSAALQYKSSVFVQAQKAIGAGFLRITFIHILPNTVPALLSACVLGLSNAILAESAMSFLGLGIQPPNPSWGRMLFEAQEWFFVAPWYALAPGFFIMFAVIAFHLLGEGLRRAFGDRNA